MAIAAPERTITALLLRRSREHVDRLGAHADTLERLELDPLSATEWESGALPLGGQLAILEACCFIEAAGGIAGAVRVSAGTRERAAIDDQVFLADRTSIKPALQDLAHLRPSRVSALHWSMPFRGRVSEFRL